MAKPRRFTKEIEKGICRLYFQDRLSAFQLAKRFECGESTIRRVIHRQGFKLRACSEAGKGKLGAKSRGWKGGRVHRVGEYIGIFKPNHPHTSVCGYVMEHRLVMEEHLSRFLNPKEVVHHINGNVADNRIDNLILFNNLGDHVKEHLKQWKRDSKGRFCCIKI